MLPSAPLIFLTFREGLDDFKMAMSGALRAVFPAQKSNTPTTSCHYRGPQNCHIYLEGTRL